MEELLRAGRALGLRLGGLPRLAAALDAALAWEAAAQRALRPGMLRFVTCTVDLKPHTLIM